ncbi:hypothetical protein [Actinomadura terrae]|uniref:hypothetical protein n=1 Tax=Actinomadura terrae TaxID=604353 RepID=UPI001FA6D226|nr:hypothetical protein [Actinomadura terrae]
MDEGEPEVPVDLDLVRRVGGAQNLEQVAERGGEGHDLLLGEAVGPLSGDLAEPGLVDGALGLDLGDPAGHDGRVTPLQRQPSPPSEVDLDLADGHREPSNSGEDVG